MTTALQLSTPVSRAHRLLPAVSRTLVLVGFASTVVVLAVIVRAQVWDELVPTLLPLPWLVAASLAVRARPDHPGALLFLGLGVGHLTAFALSEPVSLDRAVDGWGPWVLNTVATVLYLVGFVSVGAFLACYPSGLPAGPVSRWFLRLSFPLAVLAAVLVQLSSDPVMLVSQGGRATMPAPSGLPWGHLPGALVVVGPLSLVVGAGLLVARGRRADGEERRQLTWAIGAGGLLALLLLSTPAVSALSPSLQTASFVSIVAVLPFVLLGGLVRYRLMDVDLFVARTLARGAVVVLVLSAFAAVDAIADRSTGVAAAAVLAVVAALAGAPLVHRLERLVDRWLTGGRVRGQALLRRLSEQLDAPAPEDQARRTADVVQRSLDVSWVRLVTGGGLDVVAGRPPAPIAVPAATPAAVVPLLAGEVVVGRLECGPRHGGWGATELAEVGLLARHAGLALHSSELGRRLARQVVELEASRRRIVRAELVARHHLERDLHDGVQQQVVATIAHLGALRVLLPPGSREAVVAATALQQARLTLTELRAVVNGVQPPVLSDQGLVPAVASRAGLLPITVRIEEEGAVRRWPADVEAAAYYVVSEALTNTVKHAGVDRAVVRLGSATVGWSSRSATPAPGCLAHRGAPGWPGCATGSRRSAAPSWSPRRREAARASPRSCRWRPRMADPLQVVLAEDHYLVREGTRQLLELDGGVVVRAAVASAVELLAEVRRDPPDAVVTDIRMPPTHRMEGIEAALVIRAEHPGVGVVVLSNHADEAYARALFAQGSSGLAYLLKERIGDLEELTRALTETVAGRSVVDPVVVDALVRRREDGDQGRLGRLTAREREVLGHMAAGRSNTAIGEAVHLSRSAVEKNVNAIFAKLDQVDEPATHRRVAAVVAYLTERPG